MPFHPTTGNQTLRGLGILLLIGLVLAGILYRRWLDVYEGMWE